MAHSVGVTYEPEISEFDLDPRSDVMLVLASDGVWDVMSAEDIRKVHTAAQQKLFVVLLTTNQRCQNPQPTCSRNVFSRRQKPLTRQQMFEGSRRPLSRAQPTSPQP